MLRQRPSVWVKSTYQWFVNGQVNGADDELFAYAI